MKLPQTLAANETNAVLPCHILGTGSEARRVGNDHRAGFSGKVVGPYRPQNFFDRAPAAPAVRLHVFTLHYDRM